MALSNKKISLWMLAWPIFIELFLQFLLGAADTLMVSRISDDAVAVVGFSNQLFQALTTLFITVASGAGILIAQKIGSKNGEDARTIAIMAVKVSAIIGLLLSGLLILIPGEIAAVLQLPENLIPLAKTYISIVGGGMVLIALMSALSTSIRNTGNTKGPMYTAIGMNVVHVFFNYAFIFGAFGFPKWGLMGVAISTVLCRLLATIVLFIMFLSSFERTIALRDFNVFNRKLFGEILRIGWPLGVNMSCWVFTQLLIFTFLAILGSNELAARTYMNTLESFCFMLGYSIALAVQIQIAHLFGAGKVKEAYHIAFRAMWIGLAVVTVNAFLIYLFGKQLLGMFTENKEIVALGVSLLGMNLLLQPGKMINMALGNSLNAVGDTRFTMWTSVFSMWLIATGLAYFVGIQLGWGLIGIYACMILDEYIRGILSLIRWRGQKFLRRAERDEAEAKRSAESGISGKTHKQTALDI
ncbi:MATE family efflux transporter [Paenibacillus sp. FSL A5-0031]|uniref:MATE family efflux transporter n=1 Tax=unclassified Paenibacillus TaxID=185978 RepID=UPI00096FAC1D|nr:MATE family efflux transporter [Paenibacillus sp. FSL A5-0031]OME82128.1 MATE family efflux transporter [Paenibacillus sp. FSL A5-0031]